MNLTRQKKKGHGATTADATKKKRRRTSGQPKVERDGPGSENYFSHRNAAETGQGATFWLNGSYSSSGEKLGARENGRNGRGDDDE